MKKLVSTCAGIVAALVLSVGAAGAAPNVEIKIRAEKEKVVVKGGKKEKKMVEATSIAPGDVVHYTLFYRNNSKEDATKVVILDPIPEGTVYIAGSASDAEKAEFSVDGGKTFNKPTLLTYQATVAGGKKETKVSSPDSYTHVRWVVEKVPAGAGGKFKFQVRVK